MSGSISTYRNNIVVACSEHHLANVFPRLHKAEGFLDLSVIHDLDWFYWSDYASSQKSHYIGDDPGKQGYVGTVDRKKVDACKCHIVHEGTHVQSSVSNYANQVSVQSANLETANLTDVFLSKLYEPAEGSDAEPRLTKRFTSKGV